MTYKLKKSKDEVLKLAVNAVKYAKSLNEEVEFSAEDASRSDRDFLCKVFEAVIEAGATTINIPDTVGYAIPEEFSELTKYVITHTPNIGKAVVSVHCHNDLGLATANTIAAVSAGARQAEVTINGIGERAGNTSLEEVVMALHTRPNFMPFTTTVNSEYIFPTSRLVSMITGMVLSAESDFKFRYINAPPSWGIITSRMTRSGIYFLATANPSRPSFAIIGA